MKKDHKQVTIILTILLVLFLIPISAYFAIFYYEYLPEGVRQSRAEKSAEKHEAEAFEEAADYLDDHFDDFDEDNITDFIWLRHGPHIFGMPGSSLHLAIENKGETFYFTVYSEKDDLEFEVVVDSPKKKDTYDTYEDNILRRDAIITYVKLYEPIEEQFGKIILNGEWRDFYQTYENNTQSNYDLMIKDLQKLLSRVQETDAKTDYIEHRNIDSFSIEFYVDRNALEYCKENLDVLTQLSNEYTKMRDDMSDLKKTYLFIKIITKDGCELQFYKDHIVSIWDDSNGDYAHNEPLTEFVLRDTYVSSQSSGE